MDTTVPPAMPSDPVMAPSLPPKKRNWLMIAGIAVVAFIVFVGLIIGCVFSMGAPAMKAGETFLNLLTAGKVDEAYDSTAAQFKQSVPKDVFQAFLKDYPIATKVKTVSFNSFSVENGNSATLSGTVTGTDLTVSPVNMRLVNENNVWKVLYVDFMTPEQQAAMYATQQMMQQAAAQQQAQGQMQPPPGQPVSGEPAPGTTTTTTTTTTTATPTEQPAPAAVTEPAPAPAQ